MRLVNLKNGIDISTSFSLVNFILAYFVFKYSLKSSSLWGDRNQTNILFIINRPKFIGTITEPNLFIICSESVS